MSKVESWQRKVLAALGDLILGDMSADHGISLQNFLGYLEHGTWRGPLGQLFEVCVVGADLTHEQIVEMFKPALEKQLQELLGAKEVKIVL